MQRVSGGAVILNLHSLTPEFVSLTTAPDLVFTDVDKNSFEIGAPG